MGLTFYPLKYTFVYFRHIDFYAVFGTLRNARVGIEICELSATVPVICPKPLTRIVKTPVLIQSGLCRHNGIGFRIRSVLELKTALAGFLDHPQQGNASQRVVGITTSDVPMHASKPNLADPFVFRETQSIAIGL